MLKGIKLVKKARFFRLDFKWYKGFIMITLLIVEDEELTRRSLVNSIRCKDMGIDTILQASDGLEAIEIFETNTPNILITDVRMPGMDGIELARYVHSKYPDCIVAFLSGFADKEYLKAAISLGAVSYVEKPIDIDEIQSIIRDALKKLEQIREIKRIKQLHNGCNLDLFSIDTRKVCMSLLTGKIDSLILSELENLWLRNEAFENKYLCLIIKMNNFVLLQEDQYESTKQEFYNYINNTGKKYFAGGFVASILAEDRIIFFIKINNEFDDIAKEFALKVIEEYNKKIRLSFAFGNPVSDMEDLKRSYEEAKTALKITFFEREAGINLYKNINSNNYKFDKKEYYKFEKLIYDGKKDDALFFIDFLTSKVSKCHLTDIGYVKNIYYKLYTIIIDIFSGMLIKYENLEHEKDFWNSTKNMLNVFELASHVKALIEEMFEQQNISKGIDKLVLNIKAYIETNYSNHELSVKLIADHLRYDYFYICTVFKKETGNTIGKYITDCRIKGAMEILADKKVRLNDVAKEVGYSDQKYFAKVYKQLTGYTPSQYRKDHYI